MPASAQLARRFARSPIVPRGYVDGTTIVITYRSLTHGGCSSFAGTQLIVCLPRLNAAIG